LIFHFGISSLGGTRKVPRVFTEHDILMFSSVLIGFKQLDFKFKMKS